MVCQRIDYLQLPLRQISEVFLTAMGKRKKKAENIVKVDFGDYAFEESGILPVLVQHSSKDGRRIEQAIHRIPALEPSPSPAFDPRLVVEEADNNEDTILFDVEPPDGDNGGDRVRSRVSPFSSSPLTYVLIVGGFFLDMARGTRHPASRYHVVGRAYGIRSWDVPRLLELWHAHSGLIPLFGLCWWAPML